MVEIPEITDNHCRRLVVTLASQSPLLDLFCDGDDPMECQKGFSGVIFLLLHFPLLASPSNLCHVVPTEQAH